MDTAGADSGRRDDQTDPMDEAAALLDRQLGEAVRILRVTHRERWSQEELGKRSRLSKRTMGRIEKGQATMTVTQMHHIATALGVTMGELLEVAQGVEL